MSFPNVFPTPSQESTHHRAIMKEEKSQCPNRIINEEITPNINSRKSATNHRCDGNGGNQVRSIS